MHWARAWSACVIFYCCFSSSIWAHLDLGLMGGQITEALLFSGFVLIGNPLIVMVIITTLRNRKRAGFLVGLAVAQISEFSLVPGAFGLNLGHSDREAMGLMIVVGLITISASTYMIFYFHQLCERLALWLKVFECRIPYLKRDMAAADDGPVGSLLFGAEPYGSDNARALRERGCRVPIWSCCPLLTLLERRWYGFRGKLRVMDMVR